MDVRRLKMLQMVQLFKCEEDASQVSKSLCVCLGQTSHGGQLVSDLF